MVVSNNNNNDNNSNFNDPSVPSGRRRQGCVERRRSRASKAALLVAAATCCCCSALASSSARPLEGGGGDASVTAAAGRPPMSARAGRRRRRRRRDRQGGQGGRDGPSDYADDPSPDAADSCIWDRSLRPGESLSRGEFLCHGDVRFGIDAAGGRLILGFAVPFDEAVILGDDDDGSVNGTDAEANDADDSNSTSSALPATLAWRARPTSLFVEDGRSFDRIELSDDGNVLGYDASGFEIFDSNYDYRNKMEGKEDGSILVLREECAVFADVVAAAGNGTGAGGGGDGGYYGMGGGGGGTGGDTTLCLALTSPQMPGMGGGMVTWGAAVRPGNMAAMGPPPQSPQPPYGLVVAEEAPSFPTMGAATTTTTTAPVEKQQGEGPRPAFLPPTRRPTAAFALGSVGTARPPTGSPLSWSSKGGIFAEPMEMDGYDGGSGDNSGNGNGDGDGIDENAIDDTASQSIIWGTVWLDSDRNGEIDRGESAIPDLSVKLYECTDQRQDRSIHEVLVSTTDSEGMYFFQVPAGRTYRAKFDIDAKEDDDIVEEGGGRYEYSSGMHTHNNMLGWTGCETSRNESPIQWNAGLYLADDEEYDDGESESLQGLAPPDAAAAVDPDASSIGGFVYLDADGSGQMDAMERAIAVGGFAVVDDAFVAVSLTDCRTDVVLGRINVDLPGTYSFGNLTEGLYKLRYDVVAVAPQGLGGDADGGDVDAAAPAPSYTFNGGVDDGGGSGTRDGRPLMSYETDCGKLGKGEVIDSGNVGLRLEDTSEVGSDQDGELSMDTMEEMAATYPGDAENEERAVEDGGTGGDDDNGGGSFVPGLVGALVTLSVVAASLLAFVKYRGGWSPHGHDPRSAFPFLGGVGGAKSHEREEARSVGSSADGDDEAAPSADRTAIGSLIVETGNTTVAGLTTEGGGDPDDERGHTGSDEESYTGMEFALKNGAAAGKEDRHRRSSFGPGSVTSGGNSNDDADQSRHEHEVLGEGSEGYEVYDDEDDEERGDGETDYGPVVSNIIAKYAQKQQQGDQNDEALEKEHQGDSYQGQDQPHGYQQGQHPQVQSQDFPQLQEGQEHHPHQHHNQHHQWDQSDEHTTSTSGSSRSADPPAASYRDIPNAASVAAGGGWDGGGFQQPQAEDYRQYIVADDNAAAYHQDFHDHYHQGHPQYTDYETSGGEHQQAIVPSGHPQYADYDTSGGEHQQATVPSGNDAADSKDGSDGAHYQYNADYHHQQGGGGYYDSNSQYQTYEHAHGPNHYDSSEHVGGDGVEHAANYGSYYKMNQHEGAFPTGYNESHHHQYAPHAPNNEQDAYGHDQYASNDDQGAYNNQGAYDANYHGQQHELHRPQILDDDSDDDDSDSSSSSEEESASGWSSSSSTTNSSAVSRVSGIAGSSTKDPSALARRFKDRTSSTTMKSKARRAQSNPRDDRKIASWRHEAAIPENSTLEYNAYAMTNADIDVAAASEFAPTTQLTSSGDDNKSVLSTGSDQSGDPPGASYKNLHRFPPPPPRRTTPPRTTASPHGRGTPPRHLSPNTAVTQRAATPPHGTTTPPRQMSPNPHGNAVATVIAANNSRRGRSVPPPPPRGRSSPPPPPRGRPSPPPPPR